MPYIKRQTKGRKHAGDKPTRLTESWNEPNNFQKSFRKIKTKNKNPTYLSKFFRSIIWEPENFFCMALHALIYWALTYWAEILHMTLLYCTTDQVWVSSISVKFCGSYALFVTYNTGNTFVHSFPHFSLDLHALTYSAEILHMTLLYCTTDQVWVLSICINFCGSYAPFGT